MSSDEQAKKLAKLGIQREFDLVLHLPMRYEDETVITPASAAPQGRPVQVEGVIEDTRIVFRPRRQMLCRIVDASGEIVLRFFSFYPSQQKALAAGLRVRAFGEVRSGFFGAEMVHPRFRVMRKDEPLPQALTPVYPATAGVSQAVLRRLIEAVLARADLTDTLPPAICASLGLTAFSRAVLDLHHPEPDSNAEALGDRSNDAWRRIKFDELLAQQLSMRKHYRERSSRRAKALVAGSGLADALLESLPFRLTAAQARVWREIEADLVRSHPMHRLLQGDVGSGKTIVAALACLRAIESGEQAAVMAPTEILAEQHFNKFSGWLSPLGIRIAWLTGSHAKKDRTAVHAQIASGEAQLAIGTHALFQGAVAFRSLALAVVDEQHRFGVAQRLALRSKGEKQQAPGKRASGKTVETWPHQLMMSATPIPRTLSMSYYADLDISVIDELPPGRKPVLTKLVSSGRRDEVMGRIRDACAAGQQVYWVCPLIEESEALQLQTAIDTHAALFAEFTELTVGLLHGRMAPAEKAAIVAEFVAGRIDLLVATTVIEVGVDVPNASVMVVEHAERFGLAQLHQLRGRVGRGATESVCILLYQAPLGENARERLKVIFESNDGFAIAHQDLLLRGPGEYLGARQSGAPLLRFADLTRDEDLVAAARDCAEMLLEQHPDIAAAHMERWLGGRAEFLKA